MSYFNIDCFSEIKYGVEGNEIGSKLNDLLEPDYYSNSHFRITPNDNKRLNDDIVIDSTYISNRIDMRNNELNILRPQSRNYPGDENIFQIQSFFRSKKYLPRLKNSLDLPKQEDQIGTYEDINALKIQIRIQLHQINTLMEVIRQQQKQICGGNTFKYHNYPVLNYHRECFTNSDTYPEQLDLIYHSPSFISMTFDKHNSFSFAQNFTNFINLSKSNIKYRNQYFQNHAKLTMTPLKAMIFIDGTWLYYSLYRRREEICPLIQKFGRGWQFKYRFDWSALPRIICREIVGQSMNQGWTSENSKLYETQLFIQRPVEVVRASVFTSYKRDTDPNSFRVRMFEEMNNANYDVHMMETVGKNEKCVDIQLAVDMLHYATVPNAYDVAILLSGDKDFIPAMVRTRQKGRKVAVVSMRTGCNRALYESSHLKDFDVVWVDDFLDQLLVELPVDTGLGTFQASQIGSVSPITISKVIMDFISKSPIGMVSSRDVGRYLKGISITGTSSLLEDLKNGQGGLKNFIQGIAPDLFAVINTEHLDNQNRESRNKGYWILLKDGAPKSLLQQVKDTSLTFDERQFLANYSSSVTESENNDNLYYHTISETCDHNFFPCKIFLESAHFNNTNFTKKDALILTPELVSDCSSWSLESLKEYYRVKNISIFTDLLKLQSYNNINEENVKLRDLCVSLSGGGGNLSNVLYLLEQQKIRPTTGTRKPLQRLYRNIDNRVTDHLSNLVKECIVVNGGHASSRDIGRYLASSSSSSEGSLTALKELKDNYGGLANFLNRENRFILTNSNDDGSDFAFIVRLKES